MKIYTSYFAKLRKMTSEPIPISIASYSPKWAKIKRYLKLAPPRELLERYKDGEVTESEYVEVYKRQILNKLDAETVVRELEEMSRGKDVVLMCYEVSDAFCHRHLAADWLKTNGFEVTEMNI